MLAREHGLDTRAVAVEAHDAIWRAAAAAATEEDAALIVTGSRGRGAATARCWDRSRLRSCTAPSIP